MPKKYLTRAERTPDHSGAVTLESIANQLELATEQREALSALATEQREALSALSAEFKASLAKLENKLVHIQVTVKDQSETIIELEDCAKDHATRLVALEATCAKLSTSHATLSEGNVKLAGKVVNLETRSRRNNIRVLGLPESNEGYEPITFFSKMLAEVFGFDSSPECDRAHRAFRARPGPGEKPRPVTIRLHHFQNKEKIIREARAKRGKLKYHEHSIFVYEDYPQEILEQRKVYSQVMSELYQLGLKPSLLFPARLTIKPNEGGRINLSSVLKAEEYIKNKS